MGSHYIQKAEHHPGKSNARENGFSELNGGESLDGFGNTQSRIEGDLSTTAQQSSLRSTEFPGNIDATELNSSEDPPTSPTHEQTPPGTGASTRTTPSPDSIPRPRNPIGLQCNHPPLISSADMDLLLNARMKPPVTVDTLSELNLGQITSNVRLRHDANHDPDIHFMPKKEGDRGHLKEGEVEKYWAALEAEFALYDKICTSAHDSCRKTLLNTLKLRFPLMLETIRDIVLTLVPERDHDSVEQRFDIALLVQELHHGVCDMVTLVTWLAQLLKTHCAPMRDPEADDMVDSVERAIREGDLGMAVTGIRKLFQLLEHMKLDVANHQIRTFRIWLVDDTVNFLTRYFKSRALKRPQEYASSKQWYLGSIDDTCSVITRSPRVSATYRLPLHIPASHQPVARFFSVLLSHLLPKSLFRPGTLDLPETFQYDSKRLLDISTQLSDYLVIDFCLCTLEVLVHKIRSFSLVRAANFLSPAQSKAEAFSPGITRILVDVLQGAQCDRKEAMPQLAVAIARQALVICQYPQNKYHFAGVLRQATNMLEQGLSCCLSPTSSILDNSSPILIFRRTHLHRGFSSLVWSYACSFMNLPPLQIAEANDRATDEQRLDDGVPDLDKLARRVAHVGVLHWRVWANLVYVMTPSETEDEEEDEEESDEEELASALN